MDVNPPNSAVRTPSERSVRDAMASLRRGGSETPRPAEHHFQPPRVIPVTTRRPPEPHCW
jgi:hypothetical protein